MHTMIVPAEDHFAGIPGLDRNCGDRKCLRSGERSHLVAKTVYNEDARRPLVNEKVDFRTGLKMPAM